MADESRFRLDMDDGRLRVPRRPSECPRLDCVLQKYTQVVPSVMMWETF